MRIYVIGSLRNPEIPKIAATLREYGHEVFDDWWAAGPKVDDYWQRYEQARGRTYAEALAAPIAGHNFYFDKEWLDWADCGILVAPAGKSAHLEIGYLAGQGKQTHIMLPEEPERWDLMYKFVTSVETSFPALLEKL